MSEVSPGEAVFYFFLIGIVGGLLAWLIVMGALKFWRFIEETLG